MSRSQPNPAGWLWAFGAAILVTAARWREIQLHGGEIPFLDQWLVEAQQVLVPWLEGRLSFADFFLFHHEHTPAWTRLIVWWEAMVLGRWDNQLQATLNAVLMGGFTGIFASWLRRSLSFLPALILTGLAIVLASLPHSWENIVWGFQSLMPLSVFFVFVYLHGSFTHAFGTAGWWLAQAAGGAALFTLGSMWAAPFVVILVLLWTSDLNRKGLVAAGLLTLSGIALLLAARAQLPETGAATLGAKDGRQFFAALLMQLGWPSTYPGAAVLVNVPMIFLALRLRGKRDAASFDRTLLALGLWTAAQAVAFAFSRGSYIGFVSRYADLLALGVLANGVALWRLLHSCPSWSRICWVAFALGWSGIIGQGLYFINVQGHTLYFHEHSAQWAQIRRDAVREYLTRRDQNVLTSAEVRAVLFPDPAQVAQALDHPALAALLPDSVRPDGAKTTGDLFGDVSRDLRNYWLEFACGGGLLLLMGITLSRRKIESCLALETLPPPALGVNAIALGMLALISSSLLFLWPQALEFRTDDRWTPFLAPSGTVPDMSFHIVTETSYPKDRLTGGAALWPEDFRNTFFGTHIDGPAFTGTAESSTFPLASPWYIVPYAGFPVSAGNALRFRIEDTAGHTLEEITCPGPNPGSGETDIGFWAVDVRKHTGQFGRLILQDQRNANEGWVAATPPYAVTDGPKIANAHRRRWAAEGTLSGLHSLQIISAIFSFLALVFALRWWSAHQKIANHIMKSG